MTNVVTPARSPPPFAIKHMRNGHEIEHCAPFDPVLSQGGFASKPAPKAKHVQLFKMRCKVGKGFYSTAADAPDGQ